METIVELYVSIHLYSPTGPGKKANRLLVLSDDRVESTYACCIYNSWVYLLWIANLRQHQQDH